MIGGGEEVPGVLVEVGGFPRGVGEWKSVVWTRGMGGLEGVADRIFGA